MSQPLPIDTYSLTISELLHEICVELLDGQDMLDDLQAEEEAAAKADEETLQAYSFAREQIRLRMERYRELGDRVDEIIRLYDELQEELYGDLYEEPDDVEELPSDTFLHEYGDDTEEACDCDCDCCDDHHAVAAQKDEKKKDKKKEKKKSKKSKKDKKKKK